MKEDILNYQLLELYQKQYAHEVERSEKLTARVQFLLTIYTILLAGTSFFLIHLPPLDGSVLIWLHCLFLVCEVLALILSLYYAVKFLCAENDASVSPPEAIYMFKADIESFNATARPEYLLDIDNEIESLLTDQYVEAATLRFEQNNRKYGYFMSALLTIVTAAALAILCAIPYFALSVGRDKPALKVEVVDVQRK